MVASLCAVGLIVGCGTESGSPGGNGSGLDSGPAPEPDTASTTGGEADVVALDAVQGTGPVEPDSAPPPDAGPEIAQDVGAEGDDGGPPPAPGELVVTIDGEVVVHPGVVTLPSIPPGLEAEARLDVVVQNGGDGPLDVSKVELSPLNEDGSPKSVWVFLDWGGLDPKDATPATLAPGESLVLEVVYTPKSLDPNDATLRVVTDDQAVPVHVVRFDGPPIEPRVRLEPPNHVFTLSTLTVAEELVIEVHNDGLAPLSIDKIAFADGASEHFVVVDTPKAGALVKPFGALGYQPAKLTVSYQPAFGSDKESANLLVHTNDPTWSPAAVPLSSTFETGPDVSPCLFAYETEGLGYLDLGEALSGTQVGAIVGTNVSETPCTLTSVTLSNDPTGIWYDWEVELLPDGVEGEALKTFKQLPQSFVAGEAVRILVIYEAPGYGVNSELAIGYTDSQPRTKVIEVVGAGPEPCLDVGPGNAAAPLPLQTVAPKFTNVTRELVVYNCGEGSLGLTSVEIVDPATGAPSDYWTLLTPITGYEVVGPLAVELMEIAMYAQGADPAPQGVLRLGHVTSEGVGELTIPVEGVVGAAVALPVADPGVSGDYPDLVVGVPFILDGTGSEGSIPAPAEDGYAWYLRQKPAGSSLVVNGPPGAAQRIVTADITGNYTFALVVRTAGPDALYSTEATVTVFVDEAPPPDGGGGGDPP